MSDPLNDFNRRTTAGNAAWMQGPPQNTAESAAQSFLDAQQPRGGSVGGGSIDFGARICAIILLAGIVLFAVGGLALENLREGPAMMAIVGLVVSGFLILVGGGGLVVALIKELADGFGSAARRLLVAGLAGLAGWWMTPWVWMLGLPLPGALVAVAAAALVFAVMKR